MKRSTILLAVLLINTSLTYNSSLNTPPVIVINSPFTGQVFTASPITVSGTANDDDSVSLVLVKVNSGSWQIASGTASWSKSVTLESGTNTITARAEDNDGYFSANEAVNVTYNPSSGIEESVLSNAINIYPNPANGKLNIDFTDNTHKIEKLSLFNVLGGVLFTKEGKTLYTQKIEIDMSGYKAGIYYLDIRAEDGIITKKIIKL